MKCKLKNSHSLRGFTFRHSLDSACGPDITEQIEISFPTVPIQALLGGKANRDFPEASVFLLMTSVTENYKVILSGYFKK